MGKGVDEILDIAMFSELKSEERCYLRNLHCFPQRPKDLDSPIGTVRLALVSKIALKLGNKIKYNCWISA